MSRKISKKSVDVKYIFSKHHVNVERNYLQGEQKLLKIHATFSFMNRGMN